ncbi:hypothetical protein A2U01_0069518, partial [Trifolium medium]|nr:hypothetical protein [Trifolium medium]
TPHPYWEWAQSLAPFQLSFSAFRSWQPHPPQPVETKGQRQQPQVLTSFGELLPEIKDAAHW